LLDIPEGVTSLKFEAPACGSSLNPEAIASFHNIIKQKT
jgi:hypothetical protein